MIKKNIEVKYQDEIICAEIYYSDSFPWLVNLVVSNGINIMAEADDLFQALVDVRNKATKYDILILCNGARKDVYPSSMSKSTGGGIIAYKLTKGKQARRADVVNIFDPADKNLIASPKEQSVFYEEWIKSLGQ